MADGRPAISKTIHIKAAPSAVFEYLVDPKKMVRWIGLSVELDPRPAGLLRIDPNGRDVISGEILEIVPNRKVVFTWGWMGEERAVPQGSSTVVISLEETSEGTRLLLEHYQLPPESISQHEFGWTHYLNRLQRTSEGEDPGPDPFATPDTRHG